MPSSEIKVFIMEDQGAFVDGFAFYLEMRPGFKFMGSAKNQEECLARIQKKAIDVILLDIKIGNDDLAGFDVAEKILKQRDAGERRPYIAFLSAHVRAEHVDKSKEMGCSFLGKYQKMSVLLKNIETLHHTGQLVYSFEELQADSKSEDEKDNLKIARELQDTLTPSEGQVVVHLPVCPNNKEIAEAISAYKRQPISRSTVDTHLKNAYRKLNLEDNPRFKLTVLLHQSGLMNYIQEINECPRNWFGNSRIMSVS